LRYFTPFPFYKMVFPGWTIEQAETEARTKSLTVKTNVINYCTVCKWRGLPNRHTMQEKMFLCDAETCKSGSKRKPTLST
jgi:hypothetical protein